MEVWPVVVLALLLLAGCLTQREAGGDDPATWSPECGHSTSMWPQDCMVPALGTPGSKTEAWLKINPANPENIVVGVKDLNPASSPGCVWNGFAVTHDGGQTWVDVTVGGAYAERVPTDPWYGYACNTDPMFTFSADGSLHYAMEMYSLGSSGAHGTVGPNPASGDRQTVHPSTKVLLMTSHDGGLTWPVATTLLENDGFLVATDYGRITTSPTTGAIHTVMNSGNGPFLVANSAFFTCQVISSRDGGASAEPPVFLPIAVSQVDGRPSCMGIAVAPSGRVVLAIAPDFSAAGTTAWSTSEDDARTFTEPRPGWSYSPIPTAFEGGEYRTGNNFQIAYDLTGPMPGRLYAVYANWTDEDANVEVRSSADDGQTWTVGIPVKPDPLRHQWLGNVAVAGDGSVHVVYHERGHGVDDALVYTWHSVSVDNGTTWTARQLTNVGWDGNRGRHQTGSGFVGDYLGLDAVRNDVWFAVPDASVTEVTQLAAGHIVLGGDVKDDPLPWSPSAFEPVSPPPGLEERVSYHFGGSVGPPFYCFSQGVTGGTPVDGIPYRLTAEELFFEVPPGARFINGTLDWASTLPGANDLDIDFYDGQGAYRGGAYANHPETFTLELERGDEGNWLAWVYNCRNPPTDFTLDLVVE